jgi:hypothetical protein
MAAVLKLVLAIGSIDLNVFLQQEAGLRQEIVDFWLGKIVQHFNLINIKMVENEN